MVARLMRIERTVSATLLLNTVILVLPTAAAPAAPAITAGSVANGVTYIAGGLVPGSWAQVKGTNLATGNRIWNAADFSGLGNSLPTSLDGTSVKVNGQPAAVYFINSGQVNFQVPAGISGTASVQVFNKAWGATSRRPRP